MEAYIKAISYYLPEKVISNDDLVRLFPEWSVEKVASKIGVLNRHVSAENELSSDMAVEAGKNLFRDWNVSPSEIDFVMLCTQSPDYFLPTSACIIQKKLGIKTSAGAIDFNLGCSGFVYGLALAKGLLLAGIAKNILLLTSETYSKFIHPEDKGNRTIFGDAAAATLISDNGFAAIKKFDLGTDGKGAGNLIVKTGGLRNRISNGIKSADDFGNMVYEDYLFMNGGEIFNFTLESVPMLVSNVLRINSLIPEEVNLYIFHQANKYILNHLRKRLSIPEDKFYYFLENVGNTVSSTIPIALTEAIKETKIGHGSNVLIAGFGVGYSWGGNILKF